MVTIDKLCYQSKLRYVNAGEKFAFSLLTLLFTIVSRAIPISLVVLITTGILTVYKGGIPLFRYLRFLAVPLVFLLLSSLAILLHLRQAPMELFSIPLGNWYLTTDFESVRYSAELIMTALASVSCLYFLSFNTPMPDILEVLRKLHCPKLFLELMLLIYRFIFVLLSVASSITISQDSRLGNRDYKTSLHSFAAMASVLLVRAMKRSSILYDAMESRCYDGSIQVLTEDYPPRKREYIPLILFELLLLAATILWKVSIR